MDVDAINRALPVVPHEITGVDCCGCVFLREAANGVLEFVCNECGAIAGSLHRELLIALLQLEAARPVCPHCGQQNVFTGFDKMIFFTCEHCGQPVKVAPEPVQ